MFIEGHNDCHMALSTGGFNHKLWYSGVYLETGCVCVGGGRVHVWVCMCACACVGVGMC